jgi:hypothetical protein
MNLVRSLTVSREVTNWARKKNRFLFWKKRKEQEGGLQIQGNVIHTQEQTLKICGRVIWLRIEIIEEFV